MNDFGFTALTETEVEKLSNKDDKATALYNAVNPLLENLKKDTGKDYIYWPGRQKKIQEFQDQLKQILEK